MIEQKKNLGNLAEVFTEDNIRSVRPRYGMHTKYLKSILGKVADRDFKFGDRFE